MILTIPGEKPVLIEEDQDYKDRRDIQILLRKHHVTKTRPQCGCLHKGRPLELIIHHLETGRFTLRCFNFEADIHNKDCPFYGKILAPRLRGAYTTGAIEEMKDGTISVKLEGGLKASKKDLLNTNGTLLPKRSIETNGHSHKRNTVSSLGFLHLLWERSGLNRWHTKKWTSRDGKKPDMQVWKGVDDLVDAAEKINGDGIEVHKRLLVFFPNALAKNTAVFDKVAKEEFIGKLDSKKFIIIGAIKGIKKDRDNSWTVQWDGGCKNGFFLSGSPNVVQDIMDGCLGSEKRLNTPLDSREDRIIGIFIASGVRRGRSKSSGNPYISAQIERGGMMIVSRTMIPVDSSYELVLANALVEAGRSFEKPLMYDCKSDEYLPDFILHDLGDKDFPMEVFGRSDDKYKAHRKKKVQYYKNEYGTNWWEWDLTEDNRAVMPPIPPAVRPPDGRK